MKLCVTSWTAAAVLTLDRDQRKAHNCCCHPQEHSPASHWTPRYESQKIWEKNYTSFSTSSQKAIDDKVPSTVVLQILIKRVIFYTLTCIWIYMIHSIRSFSCCYEKLWLGFFELETSPARRSIMWLSSYFLYAFFLCLMFRTSKILFV